MGKDGDAAIISYKGFDKNMQCRGYQFEVGKSYTHDGGVKCCPTHGDIAKGNGGFHSCEYPLDVFRYYAPAESVYATVEASGGIDKESGSDDSKLASSKIKVKASIDLAGIIAASIEYTLSRVKKPVAATNSGDSGAATN
jgi:hypothetical protein